MYSGGTVNTLKSNKVPGPEVIKLFMLNSAEHEVSIAHKYLNSVENSGINPIRQ